MDMAREMRAPGLAFNDCAERGPSRGDAVNDDVAGTIADKCVHWPKSCTHLYTALTP